MSGSSAPILKNKGFLFLLVGQIISQFGDQLNRMALLSLIYFYAPGSSFELSKFMIIALASFLIWGPLSGVWIDRWNRKMILVVSDLVRGFLVLSVPLLVSLSQSIHPAYLITFLVLSINRFFSTAKSALLPHLVIRNQLLMANSLTSSTGLLLTLFGSALGGIVVEWTGWQLGFYLDSLSYFLSALILSFLVLNPSLKPSSDLETPSEARALSSLGIAEEERIEADYGKIWKELKNSLQFIRDNRIVRFVIISLSLLMAMAGTLFVLLPVLVRQRFNVGTEGVGFLILALGLGALIGSFLVGSFGSRITKRKIVLTCFFPIGLLLILLALATSYTLFISIVLLLGIVSSPIIITAETLLQTNVPTGMRGTVFSSRNVIESSMFLFFGASLGLVADLVNKQAILIALGLCSCLFPLVFWKVTRYEVKHKAA